MLELRVLSPIAKIFPQEAPAPCAPQFAGLSNEVISFQLAYRPIDPKLQERLFLRMEIDSPVRDRIHARRVKCVPVRLPALSDADDNYLGGKLPGLYPDILDEIPPHGLRAEAGQWEALWFDFRPDSQTPAGDYSATIRLYKEGDVFNGNDGLLLGEITVSLHVIAAELPPQKLIHTKWLHTDCLADWYGVEVFSEEYWRITENYVRCAVEHGINAILTPVHTPPLDTRVGTYRPTVQLVDVSVDDGRYTFGFERLERWVEMCRRCGVEYYEIAHLFTQWGAQFAPQIVAQTKDGLKRIFGWDTPAAGEDYAAFLDAYLPALLEELERLGVADRTIFHISDEPSADHLQGYLTAKVLVRKHLRGRLIVDALSDPAFYDSGAVEHPIPGSNHIEPFLERNIPDLWTYYCVGQGVDVSNLFIAMSGARTRVLGAQLYKFDIKGFLQWGFNFYYAQYSDYLINPWLDTDNDRFSPAGDAYQVYPGRDGRPVASVRLMLVQQALQDLRAMELLETLAGRDAVLKLIDEGVEPIRFARYPHSDEYVLGLRERVNAEIEKRL